MSKQNQLMRIKEILSNRLHVCPICGFTWLPVGERYLHDCPECERRLNREYKDILNEDMDSFDDIVLEE